MRQPVLYRLCGLLLAAALLLCGCTAAGSPEENPWLAGAALDAEESAEELYQKALGEDILILYAISTRAIDAKRTFEAQYPGLVVELYDIRGSDLLNLLRKAHETGEYICDLVICADNNAVISRELVPMGVLYKYVPPDIEDSIYPEFNQEDLMFMAEAQITYYNSEAHSEPPFTNWWHLTEPRFANRVYLPNPLKSLSTFALFSTIIEQSDLMAQSYEELYGEPLAVPEGSSAGQEYIRMLMANGAVLTNSGDEVADAVGMPGQKGKDAVGIMISSKVRLNDAGYKLAPNYAIEPFVGTFSPNSIMIPNGSKNINSAKLFVRWILGEADGKGEGAKPFMCRGCWPVREGGVSEETVPLESLELLHLNKDYIYEQYEPFERFWTDVLAETRGLPAEMPAENGASAP